MYTVTIPTHVETSPKVSKTLLNTSQHVFTTFCALRVELGSKQQSNKN